MFAELKATPEDYLIETLEFRESEPTQTNLLGSVAAAVVMGIQVYQKCYWWVVRDAEANVVGCAMHCAPQGFCLSPMVDEAARTLASAVAASDEIPFPSVHGPMDPSTVFIEQYKKMKGMEDISVSLRKMLLYDIDVLTKPTNVAGELKLATMEDLDLSVQWTRQFFLDAKIYEEVDHEGRNRGKIKEGSFYFWMVGDQPVAMGGHAVPVQSGRKLVARIGPIYTPSQHRKRGYGSAITAGITEALQERGCKVMLFADAENPDSNKIYQNIGFELTCENAEYRFER